MKIKQGKTETPLKLKGTRFEALEALCHRAGAVARLKTENANEEAEIKAEFAKLRPGLEKAHGLAESYTASNGAGAIAVTLGGRSFALFDKFKDPTELELKLTALGEPELLQHFKITVAPDQRGVKDHMGKALLKVGALVDKESTVALKAV